MELKTETLQESLNKMLLKKINYGYIPTISGYGYIGGQGLDNDKVFQKINGSGLLISACE